MKPSRIFWGLTAPFAVIVIAYEVSRLWVQYAELPSKLPDFLQRSLLWAARTGLHWVPVLSFTLVLFAPLLLLGAVALSAPARGRSGESMRLAQQAFVMLVVSLAAAVVIPLAHFFFPISEENPLSLLFLASWVMVSAQVAAISAAFKLQRGLRTANRSRVPPWLLVAVGAVLQLPLGFSALAGLVVLVPVVTAWRAGQAGGQPMTSLR